METGLDVTKSAEYFNLCIDGTAIATVADSFGALEQRVEREGRISWEELYRHLKSDFQEPAGSGCGRCSRPATATAAGTPSATAGR